MARDYFDMSCHLPPAEEGTWSQSSPLPTPAAQAVKEQGATLTPVATPHREPARQGSPSFSTGNPPPHRNSFSQVFGALYAPPV